MLRGSATVILQPGFLDHWKTRLLVELAGGDETAIFAVLRLWEFCQMRRKWEFNGEVSDTALNTICRLRNARELLHKSGFLDIKDENTLVVHDWEKENRFIVNCWINGSKGGRKPKKKTKKPTGNPRVTHGEPVAQPVQSNLILSNLSVLKEGVRGRFEEWMKIRKGMKKVNDFNALFSEQAKWLAHFSEADQVEILSKSIRNGWQGLFALDQKDQKTNGSPEISADTRRKINDLRTRRRELATTSNVKHDDKARAEYAGLSRQIEQLEAPT